jgi:adenosylhomocysteine nucleosidase
MFPLRRESMFFRRNCRPHFRLRQAPCLALLCGGFPHQLLLLETGVGRIAVEAALDWTVAVFPRLRFVLLAGFAGALAGGLRVGDLVVADSVVDEAGQFWPTCLLADHTGSQGAETVAVSRGRLLTSDRLIASPEEKQRLGTIHQAHAVDMEAAYAAAFCAGHNLLFGCIRAISDPMTAALAPEVAALLCGGQVAPMRVVAAVLRKPGLLREFWRLHHATELAARRLCDGLRAVLHVNGGQTGESRASHQMPPPKDRCRAGIWHERCHP